MALTLPRTINTSLPDWRSASRNPWAGVAVALAAMGIAAAATGDAAGFPVHWVTGAQNWFTSADGWVTNHQGSAPIFTDVVTPIGGGLGHLVNAVADVLAWLTWPGVMALAVFAAFVTGGWRTSIFAACAVAVFGLLGLWTDSMTTLALMTISIVIALAIGIPLGVVAGFSDPFERLLKPVLDTAQMLPAYVYLLPVVILFSVGVSGGVVVTVIYATPPVVRLTSLGIRTVRADVIEAGTAFGATRWQLLKKVQLPLAMRPILLGINQVIMMALSIVVLASLIGAPGLGADVLANLTTVNVGGALTPGIAIVAMAMLLDRIVSAYGIRAVRTQAVSPDAERRRRLVLLGGAAAMLLVALVSHYALSAGAFPASWSFSISGPVNTGLNWLGQHLYHFSSFPVLGGTQNLSNFLTSDVLNPMTRILGDLPWWAAVFATGGAGVAVGGWRRGATLAACVTGIGLLGVWTDSTVTLAQVIVALVLCILVGIPIGVLAYWSKPVDQALRPVLDVLQTLPAFVYLIPVVLFFSVGNVAGVIASFVYAVPVSVRLTKLGLQGVRGDIIEAGTAFGATRFQLLGKVEMPAARPALLLAVNQTIMLVLAEVIVAGLVGSGGLGYDVVVGLDRDQFGPGLAAGLAIVLMGIVFDRLTQGGTGTTTSAGAST